MPETAAPDRLAAPEEWRQALIIRRLWDYAGRWYRLAGDGARYVIEGYIPGATREEWDWAEAWFRAHRDEILAAPDRTDEQIRDGDAVQSARHSDLALEAFREGEYDLALYLIDVAEWWKAEGQWDRIRTVIRDGQASYLAETAAAAEVTGARHG